MVPLMPVSPAPDRRELLATVAALGIGSTTFHRAVLAQAQPPKAEAVQAITAEMVQQAEWVAGITLSDEQRKKVADSLTRALAATKAARTVELGNDVPPALVFYPQPGPVPTGRGKVELPDMKPKKPESDEDLAFSGVATLAQLLRAKKVSSVELTKLYLARLAKYDPGLKCVVTVTEELALKQAKAADEEIAKGTIRGPLHGIPWGAKDLIAYPGYKTTWGAEHYKDQTIDRKATVARRLDDAGAVLVAKLTLGALAGGDVWFGGKTRNPWDVTRGSSGSSAGSASAVAAGCVPFAIGSETMGSIVSPSRECGVTGLRPTFGRVGRGGCMTLSWSMDKLGPICRSVEDAALVLGMIHGTDPDDACAVERPFDWPGNKSVRGLTVGFIEKFNQSGYEDVLKVLKDLGAKLVPIQLPSNVPASALKPILDAESAAAFDHLTRAGVADGFGTLWPTPFRAGQFVSAVDYIRANRIRNLLMKEMAKLMETVDLYVGGNDLQITNHTGHPTVSLPCGFTGRKAGPLPQAVTFTGRLFGETELLTVTKAFQDATDHHTKRPPVDKVTKENAEGK